MPAAENPQSLGFRPFAIFPPLVRRTEPEALKYRVWGFGGRGLGYIRVLWGSMENKMETIV